MKINKAIGTSVIDVFNKIVREIHSKIQRQATICFKKLEETQSLTSYQQYKKLSEKMGVKCISKIEFYIALYGK